MTISSNECECPQSRGSESFLQHIYDRALAQLECTQQMRKGQALPLQMDVKIS